MAILTKLRNGKIRRIVILAISLAIASTVVLGIIFAVLNIKFVIDEGDDDDDDCKIWKRTFNIKPTLEPIGLYGKQSEEFDEELIFEKIIINLDESCNKMLVIRGQPCEGNW